MNIIYATRRAAQCALDRQPINGFAVALPGNLIVFHPYRDRWQLARRGSNPNDGEWFESPRDLLNVVFKEQAK